MTDLPLRAACIHGRYEGHTLTWDYNANATEECPGGRDITIDHEAAVTAYVEGPSWVTTFGLDQLIRRVVAAAIGATANEEDHVGTR